MTLHKAGSKEALDKPNIFLCFHVRLHFCTFNFVTQTIRHSLHHVLNQSVMINIHYTYFFTVEAVINNQPQDHSEVIMPIFFLCTAERQITVNIQNDNTQMPGFEGRVCLLQGITWVLGCLLQGNLGFRLFTAR